MNLKIVCFSTPSCHSAKSIERSSDSRFLPLSKKCISFCLVLSFCFLFEFFYVKFRVFAKWKDWLKEWIGWLVMSVTVGREGSRALISKLPWPAAIAVRGYEGSFAKVRQIPRSSVLIGLSSRQNRQGMQWAWSSELSETTALRLPVTCNKGPFVRNMDQYIKLMTGFTVYSIRLVWFENSLKVSRVFQTLLLFKKKLGITFGLSAIHFTNMSS